MSKKILFIDDEPYFMRAHIDTLKDEGYRVDEAGDGGEALEKLETKEYDLIVLDIIMPAGGLEDTNGGMRTGLRLHEIIRQRLRLTAPILFLTVVDSRENHQHIRNTEHECEGPPHTILVKPVLPSELVERVRELLGEGRGSR